METREASLVGLPYNIRRMESRRRSWNSVGLEITDAWYGPGEVLHPLVNEDSTRLTVMIEEVGGVAEPRFTRSSPCPVEHRPCSMAFGPAGRAFWGYSADLKYCRDATFMMDVEAIAERLHHHVPVSKASEPRLRFADARIWTLAKMLVELRNDDPSTQPFGDNITAAIFALLFKTRETATYSGQLAPWQVRRVIEYIEARLPQPGRVAGTLGIGRTVAVALCSEMTGFGDPMHLIRVFKKKTGVTPGAWRSLQ